MSAPVDALSVLRAHVAEYEFDGEIAEAVDAMDKLVAAARDGAAVLQSKAGPLEQETVRRLYAALARVGGGA